MVTAPLEIALPLAASLPEGDQQFFYGIMNEPTDMNRVSEYIISS
jgi:hypothetical protein